MLDVVEIERLRVARGLSQKQAAAAAGLSGCQHWKNIVTGKRAGITLRTLGRIASALRVSPRQLIRDGPVDGRAWNEVRKQVSNRARPTTDAAPARRKPAPDGHG